MKFNQGIWNEISRACLFLLLGVGVGGFVLTGSVICFLYGGTVGKFLALFVLLWVALWWCFVATAFHSLAAVTMSDEGIYIRVLLNTKFLRWRDISQAGILWRTRKYGYYNDFVLLKPGGSVRRYGDKSFALRNVFRLIHLPATQEVRDFVTRHYGPLDFDLSDGKAERSVIVD